MILIIVKVISNQIKCYTALLSPHWKHQISHLGGIKDAWGSSLGYDGLTQITLVLKVKEDRAGVYSWVGLLKVEGSKKWFEGAKVGTVGIV